MDPWNSLEPRNGALEFPGASKWSSGAPWSLEMETWGSLEPQNAILRTLEPRNGTGAPGNLEMEPWRCPEPRNETLELPGASKLSIGDPSTIEMDGALEPHRALKTNPGAPGSFEMQPRSSPEPGNEALEPPWSLKMDPWSSLEPQLGVYV